MRIKMYFNILVVLTIWVSISMVESLPVQKNPRKSRPQKKSMQFKLEGLVPKHWVNPCQLLGSFNKSQYRDAATMNESREMLLKAIDSVRTALKSIHTVVPNGKSLERNYTNLPDFKKHNNDKRLPHKDFKGRMYHKDLQVFVGLTDVLHHQFKSLDTVNGSKFAKEMEKYQKQSKYLLCEFQTFLNNTNSPFHHISRKTMITDINKMIYNLGTNETELLGYDAFFVETKFKEYVHNLHNKTDHLNSQYLYTKSIQNSKKGKRVNKKANLKKTGGPKKSTANKNKKITAINNEMKNNNETQIIKSSAVQQTVRLQNKRQRTRPTKKIISQNV